MTIITNQTDLDKLCAKIDETKRFAMDLEFIPEKTYKPELCLVQVATNEGPVIIDPLKVRDLTSIWQRVSDPNILVVLHAAEHDLNLVYEASSLLPQNIMDTQIAAGFAGYGYPCGYGKLLQQVLGVTVSKTESYTDWLARPLTDSQIEYALDDVRHLLDLNDRLVKKLNSLKRLDWVKQEYLLYSTPDYYQRSSDGFLRVKGASALSRKGLAVLRSLWTWRDNTACKQNRPPKTVMPDNILLEICRKPPHNAEAIKRIRGVRDDLIHNWGKQIIAAVDEGVNLPSDDYPSWPSHKAPPQNEVLIGDILFAVLKVICSKCDIAPELVATRSDLQTLIHLHKEEKTETSNLPILNGWRLQIAGNSLLSLLRGALLQMHLSYSESPIEMEIQEKTS